ncbi:MAG TPA: RluA family pseudouridine synthase [Planctomycetaceae bacterium]|nr:RNA pseudouridine synthase [Blastopirellula sp.]HAY81651.1 RluA family pseudouridine synthase [Planctomycetaceae bacterium]
MSASQIVQPKGFSLLYEKGPCLVVNKPAGVLTQAPPGIDSLERRIKQFLQERSEKGREPYLGVPHRLDRPASGAMVFAKQVRAARHLAEQFETRVVKKTYWALLQGELPNDSGAWEDSLRKIPGEARAEVVPSSDPTGKIAQLEYQVLSRETGYTWVEIRLKTGRTHQIRVQSATRSHAILGDQFYGATTDFGPPSEDLRERAIALHARSLSFYHPKTDQRVEVTAPVPEYWPAAIRQ